MIRAVVGAGGKTGLIRKLAKEFQAQGKKVFVTTSTHMFIEQDTMLTDDADQIILRLEETGYAMAGIPMGEKIGALSMKTYEKVCRYADEVLIEADGSKHMPIKFPNEKEPVIYENVDEILVVSGLHALGKTLREAAHRPELVKACLGIEEDGMIEPCHIQKLIRKGYIEPLKNKYPQKTITIQPNAGASLYQRALAALLATDMDVSVLKEEWFDPQPRLIVCGAGHVAGDLVKMAACLDFYIKVIDDRSEFACKERFPGADEVICDTFDHLEKYLEPNAFYVVVTRGHKDDYECVRTILNHSYQYLGMIGSRLKVAKTFENLQNAGISQEQIQTIHAPIGLPIHAVTPAEIAVSILAEIISEKNTRSAASASGELLRTTEPGVLCVIIEKKGSTPRGVGSMMFVTDSAVIDSVGGGAVEFAAIGDARITKDVTIREYDLDNETSRKLGMICGGSLRILFIPVAGV